MRSLVLAAALISVSSAALAEDWSVACTAQECAVSRTLADAEQNRRFATIALTTPKGGGASVLTVTTPLGVAIEPGVRLVMDDLAFGLPFKVCFPDGCAAARPLEPDELSALLTSASADLRFFAFGTGEQLSGAVSLDGLDAAQRDALSRP